MAQTKHEIQAILTAAGFRPLKRFGQHFLIDGNLMRKLVSAAAVTRDDVVLEVGPGTGSLTEELLKEAGHIVTIEIDSGLHAICRDRFSPSEQITPLHGDVLERKSVVAPEVLQTLQAWQEMLGGRIMMVANLPYQVATPLVIDLLLGQTPVSPLCFTVQAEVADRILASPGTKSYGPVSILTQALTRTRRIARVPAEAFWPMPKVASAMLRLDVRQADRQEDTPSPAPPPAVRQRLAELVHGCFNHRRKTMKWNLQRLLDEDTFRKLEASRLSPDWTLTDRPEQLTVDQWLALTRWLI